MMQFCLLCFRTWKQSEALVWMMILLSVVQLYLILIYSLLHEGLAAFALLLFPLMINTGVVSQRSGREYSWTFASRRLLPRFEIAFDLESYVFGPIVHSAQRCWWQLPSNSCFPWSCCSIRSDNVPDRFPGHYRRSLPCHVEQHRSTHVCRSLHPNLFCHMISHRATDDPSWLSHRTTRIGRPLFSDRRVRVASQLLEKKAWPSMGTWSC